MKGFARPVRSAITLLALAIALTGASRAGWMRQNYFEELSIVKKVLGTIEGQYVEKDKAERSNLVDGAIEGMIKSLKDPYSRHMKREAFSNMQTETSGKFGGLGILIGMKDEILTVIAPIEGTPAYRAGLRAADRIVKVDGKLTKGMSVNDAVKLLRGEVGTKVIVTISREGESKFKDYEIVRGSIKVSSVKAKMIDDHIGYARLTGFIQTTGSDLEKAITEFEKKHDLQGFIVDLRNNPGGLLNAAVEVSKVFLGQDRIVSIKGRNGHEVEYRSFREKHKHFPVVVLINRGSASASEIVAGAIRDNRRGILVGKRSFGKGSVQTVLPMPDGSALALTTAYYYTPSGVCIHEEGISPHIDVDLPTLTDEQIKELREEREKEFVEEANEANGGDPEKRFMKVPRYDTQLARAVEILRCAQVFYKRIIEDRRIAGKSQNVRPDKAKVDLLVQ